MCDIDSTKKALLRRNLNDDNRRKMRTFITSPVDTHQIQGPGREIEYVKVTKPCLQDGGETLQKKNWQIDEPQIVQVADSVVRRHSTTPTFCIINYRTDQAIKAKDENSSRMLHAPKLDPSRR